MDNIPVAIAVTPCLLSCIGLMEKPISVKEILDKFSDMAICEYMQKQINSKKIEETSSLST